MEQKWQGGVGRQVVGTGMGWWAWNKIQKLVWEDRKADKENGHQVEKMVMKAADEAAKQGRGSRKRKADQVEPPMEQLIFDEETEDPENKDNECALKWSV